MILKSEDLPMNRYRKTTRNWLCTHKTFIYDAEKFSNPFVKSQRDFLVPVFTNKPRRRKNGRKSKQKK